jgi:hypothetical protein
MLLAVGKHFGLEPHGLDEVKQGMDVQHRSIGKGAKPRNATWNALDAVYGRRAHWREELMLFGQ